MAILTMSLKASILILAVVIIRALALYRLPKRTFPALWGLVLYRLLVPFSIPSRLSIYSAKMLKTAFEGMNPSIAAPEVAAIPDAITVPDMISPASTDTAAVFLSPVEAVWLIGLAAFAVYFLASHLRRRRDYMTTLPIDREFVSKWVHEHPLRREVKIRQSDKIAAALTYGTWKPVVLLPKTTDWTDETKLNYILTHEYVHIRRFDIIFKWLLAAALCVHWFNPLVWVMYILSNRDIELSCDETVVRTLGEGMKSSYALTLIGLEEKRTGPTPLVNNFSKNAIEERIVSIMKMKKSSLTGIILACALIIGTAGVFATNPVNPGSGGNNAVVDEGAEKIPGIGPTRPKQSINVDIKLLKSGEGVNLGQYSLEKGDVIAYRLTSEGTGNLTVGFYKADKYEPHGGYMGETGFTGKAIDSGNSPCKVPEHLAGDYYLWVGNYDGGALNNIKGSVEIAVEKYKDESANGNDEAAVLNGKTYADLTKGGDLEVNANELSGYKLYTNSQEIRVSIPEGEYEGRFILYDAENSENGIQEFILNGSNRTKAFSKLTAATNYFIDVWGMEDVKVKVTD